MLDMTILKRMDLISEVPKKCENLMQKAAANLGKQEERKRT